MSSPAASASGDRKKPAEQITFRFCSECSNMLYPKEDENDHKLMFTCRTCSFSEEATSSCIFRNVLNNAAGETAGVTQDVGSDPTVGSSLASCSCSIRPGDSESSAGLATYVSCLHCGRMVVCECCGIRFAVLPICDQTPSPDTEMSDFRIFDNKGLGLEDVEILACEDIADLASFMANTQDFFGLEDMDVDELDEEPENVTLPAASSLLSAPSAA